jgi:aminopeptidase-like protein
MMRKLALTNVLNKILQQRMWILNYSDGNNDLLSVAKKSGFNLLELKKASLDLVEVGLIYGEEI